MAFSIVNGPTHGTLGAITQLSPTSAQVTYTPTANFFGSDSFTFRVSDAMADSNTATVSITVTQVTQQKGDVNGSGIAVDDVILISDFILGRQVPTQEQQFAADVFPSKAQTGGVTCGDGATDIGDILVLADVILDRTSIAAQCS